MWRLQDVFKLNVHWKRANVEANDGWPKNEEKETVSPPCGAAADECLDVESGVVEQISSKIS